MIWLLGWLLFGLFWLVVSLPLSTENKGPTPAQLLFYAVLGPITFLIFVWWTNSGKDSKLKGWLDKPLW